MDNIYELELFDETTFKQYDDDLNGVTVRRVPGGWIFTEWNERANYDAEVQTMVLSSTFVPWNTEFEEKYKVRSHASRPYQPED